MSETMVHCSVPLQRMTHSTWICISSRSLDGRRVQCKGGIFKFLKDGFFQLNKITLRAYLFDSISISSQLQFIL